MIVTAVLQEIADLLDEIPGLNVFPYWVKKVPVPGATVGLPSEIEYDQTYGRGLDKMTVPIIVLVGMVSAKASAAELNAYMDGSGARSIKWNLNGARDWASCDDVVVRSVIPDTYSSGGVVLLGAEFTVDVYGKGETS